MALFYCVTPSQFMAGVSGKLRLGRVPMSPDFHLGTSVASIVWKRSAAVPRLDIGTMPMAIRTQVAPVALNKALVLAQPQLLSRFTSRPASNDARWIVPAQSSRVAEIKAMAHELIAARATGVRS
jgi:cell envelope opacity-associated protein A